jgi:hypothetical protein
MKSLIKITGLLSALLFYSCNRDKASEFSSADRSEILNVLSTQEAAWNQGDIPEFMKGYHQSDSMQFIGSSGINFGWQETLDNYKLRYPDTVAMGKLHFEILKINPISGEAAYLTGKFHLKRTIGDAEGIFTLILRKIDGKWKVVYDHTS